jgi:hypothetical protein
MLFARPGLGAQKKTKVDTMLRLEGNYQDNVFLSESDPKSGYNTSAIPGLHLSYVTDRSRADLEYKAHVKYFSYDTGQAGIFADENYDIFHEGQLRLETRTRPSGQRGLAFNLDEQYFDNQTLSQVSTPSIDRQNKYFTNTLQPEIGLELSKKFRVLASYQNEIVRFRSSSGNDSTQHSYGADIEYYRSRRTFFSLGYRQTQKNFEKTANYAVNEGVLGIRRILNRTWSAGISLSYQMRDYDENAGVSDWSGMATTVFVRAVRKKKLNIELTYQNKRNSFDSSVSYRIDRFDLKNRWTPTRKLSLDFGPYYQKDTYDFPHGRRDSLWGFRSQFAVHPKKHVSLGVGYDHTNRDSNRKGLSYKNNTYYLFFTLKRS